MIFVAGAVLHGTAPVAFSAECADLPRCTGCGCKGGPGYRGPNGQCVGYAQLARVCGTPPTTRCTFEDAPNTGLNRDCVAENLERRSKAKANAIRALGF